MKKLGDRRRRRTGDRVTDDTDRPGTADRPVLIHLNILIFLISLILIIFIFLVAVLRRTRLLRNGCHTFTLVSRLPDLADDFQILFRLTRPLLSQQRSNVLHGIRHPRHLRPDSSHLCTRLLRLSQLVDQRRHTLADDFDEHPWPFSDHKHLPIHFPSRVLLRRWSSGSLPTSPAISRDVSRDTSVDRRSCCRQIQNHLLTWLSLLCPSLLSLWTLISTLGPLHCGDESVIPTLTHYQGFL